MFLHFANIARVIQQAGYVKSRVTGYKKGIEIIMGKNGKKGSKSRSIQIIVIVVSLCVIIGEVMYIIAGGLGKEQETSDIMAVNNVQVSQQSTAADNIAEDDNDQADNAGKAYKKYVFVGDSRYVGMSKVETADEDIYIAKNNMGYSYLEEQMSLIRQSCDDDTALIIGLGVNDMRYSLDKYIIKINEMADSMNCQIYYMLVNPVDEVKEASNGYGVENTKIDEFNEKMKESLSNKVKIIDTNSYLKKQGYTTQDGLHYDNATYKLIYDYIKANL